VSDDVRRLVALEQWRREHEAEHARLRGDIRLEVQSMTDAAVRHVEKAMRGVTDPLKADLDALKGTNATQLELLREAAEERGRRRQREEEEERRRKERADDLEALKVSSETRARRWAAYAALATAIFAGLAGLVTAALASHGK
jgi:septal ring factor EnvC (AmiA/AmiB activator)